MTVARIMLLPIWLIQLASGAKAFCDNPVIGSRRLNRWGLHSVRVRIAHRLAASRRRRLTGLLDASERKAFDRDGFLCIRGFLPEESFARLTAQTRAYRGTAREMVQGDTITRRIPLDPAALRAIPAARDLLANRRWRALIRYVGSFDAEPLTYIQTILSRRKDAPPDPQTALHADTFHPTVKAWLFLEDVSEDDGPFIYVPGSHRASKARLRWERERSIQVAPALDRLSARGSFRIDPSELGELGLPAPVHFAVPANTLVVADTFGFHARGISAYASTRVEIFASGRRNPFMPWVGLDLLGMPGIAERRMPLYWKLRDSLRRYHGHPWKDVGKKRAADQ